MTKAKKEPYKIFLSCGAPYVQAQEDFVAAIEAHLRSHNCEPLTVGRTKFSVRQPIQFVRDLTAESDGALIIAFERIRVNDGLDRPGSSDQSQINGQSYPTVWNQLEGAIAYAKNLPLLTLVQKGVYRQGMLSDRLEWFALEDELSPALLRTDRFRQFFQDWSSRVEARKLNPKLTDIDPSHLKIGELISLLTPQQLWSFLGAIFGVLVTVATVAYALGQFFAKP